MRLYRHKSKPEWGTAQLVTEKDDKRSYVFSDGKQRVFPRTHWAVMLPLDEGDVSAPAPMTEQAETTDLRAISTQMRVIAEPATNAAFMRETPPDGALGNAGYWLMNDVLLGWLVGAREAVEPVLSRAMILLEEGRAKQERYGDSLLSTASQREALALGCWLRGDDDRASQLFLEGALFRKQLLDEEPKERRTGLGAMLLAFCSAGDPAQGLGIAKGMSISKRSSSPMDMKTKAQNRYWDALTRIMMTLTELLDSGASPASIHNKAMAYLQHEVKVSMNETTYSFFDIPKDIIIARAFASKLVGIENQELAIASLYRLTPAVRRPERIAALLADRTQSS